MDTEGQVGNIYRRLGVEPIINGNATLTRLGGSIMPPAVAESMREASQSFVDLLELQDAVGKRIAELTFNEAAFICGGAAAGLFLATAACMARDAPHGVLDVTALDRMPRELIVHRAHRIPYDLALILAGGQLVEIGSWEETPEAQLENAYTPRTVAVFYFTGSHIGPGALDLEVVIASAHARGIPVIVDAAAQLPPRENLWRFTERGADLVLFSGSKGLRGPASTGLILGRPDLVARCAANASPLQQVGRPMKVGKEDMIGILHAVECYMQQDQRELMQWYEDVVQFFVEWGHQRKDVVVRRDFPNEAGQPMPRVLIQLADSLARDRDHILTTLFTTVPRIDLAPAGDDGLYVNPQPLAPGEEQVIASRLSQVIDSLSVAPR